MRSTPAGVSGQEVRIVSKQTSDLLPSIFPMIDGVVEDVHAAGVELTRLLLRRIEGEAPEALQTLAMPRLRDADLPCLLISTDDEQVQQENMVAGGELTRELTLTVRGVARDVVFDHAQGGFSAEPIWRLLDGEVDAELLYRPVLKFLEV